MKTQLMLCALAAGLCGNAAEPEFEWDASDLKLSQSAESQAATPMEAHLQDVQAVYRELARVHAVYWAQENAPSNKAACVDVVKAATESLRPVCARLRALPATELRQLVLLADAIAWQSDWVRYSYMAEHNGDAVLQSSLCGLELVAELSDFIVEALQHPSSSAEEETALRELLTLFGGEAYLPVPRRLLDYRLAKDYKTAYLFFEEFYDACLSADAAACVEKLKELESWLDYLLQGGEADRLRVAALACAYRQAVSAQKLPRPVYVTGEEKVMTVLEIKRKEALETFFNKLPALKGFFIWGIRCRM